ncbi:MAG: hypothetical protein PSX36_10675 [bacterium]|nr:hypothetical protein [bacterium]
MDEIYKTIDDPKFVVSREFKNNVTLLFKEFVENHKENLSTEILRQSQIEIDLQNFQINSNKLSPIFTQTSENGDYYEFPSLRNYDDSDYNYVKDRFEKTKNTFLKVRYGQILWLSPKKHIKYGDGAFQELAQQCRQLNKTVWSDPDKMALVFFKHLLLNLFYLSTTIKKADNIKSTIIRLSKTKKTNEKTSYFNLSMVQLMLANPRIFAKKDFQSIEKLCVKLAEATGNLEGKIDIYKIGEQVNLKLEKRTPFWNNKLAEVHEMLSKPSENGDNFGALIHCKNSIKYYRKTKNKAKISELESLYKTLKQTMKLGGFPINFDITETVKNIEKATDEITTWKSDKIIAYLANSKEIFPSYESIYQESLAEKKQNYSHFIFGVSVFDDLGHTSAHFNDDDEKMHYAIMKNLSIQIHIAIHFINSLVWKCVRKNKLTPLKIVQYLRQNSWLGQDITILYSQQENKNYNWLELISPGINDFLSQLYFYSISSTNVPNYVLCTDSLTLKIEGIFRDICELRGATTFFQTEDQKGRTVVREKDINLLFREQTIIDTIQRDDLYVFQFILVDKVGFNLRNLIAHSLIREGSTYGISYPLLLLIIILRLSKNEYGPPTKEK